MVKCSPDLDNYVFKDSCSQKIGTLNILSHYLPSILPAPIAQLVECPLRGTGGNGFDLGPLHTKVVKNGTSYSWFGTQTYGVELGLVDPVSE